MKTNLIPLLLSLAFYESQARAQFIFDDFLSSQIDAARWSPRTPFSDSSITLTGQTVILLNHGELLTTSELGSTLEVKGRFRFTGNIHDVFTIAIRTTGAAPDPRFFNDGFHFEIAKASDDGTRVNIVQVTKYVSGIGTVVAATNQDFSMNQFYDFKISDDGNGMKFYFDQLDIPLLTVTDPTPFGHKVGLYNREGAGGGSSISAGSQVEVDFIQIESGPRVDLIKAVKPSFSNLAVGQIYQLQVSADFKTWTNQGPAFTATNVSMTYPQYWDVSSWNSMYFRLQSAP